MEPWKRKEVIGGCTLYLGDALAILPTLPPADLAVSDVPYALTSGGQPDPKGHRTMAGIFAKGRYANDGQIVAATVPFPDMMAAIYAALKPDADCYVMANDKNVHPLTDAALKAGFQFHNLLAWDKITPTANRWYMKNLEFTLYLWKGRARTINNPSSKQLIRGGIEKESGHPTEKPVHLMAEYIFNSSQRGGVVLDPFMGSGTTGVAAAQLGRQFVGIEIDDKFFDLACERIQRAYDHPDLYAEHDEPEQLSILSGAA
jgi:site-specific DNA-methyltransferase (adenine-specific)